MPRMQNKVKALLAVVLAAALLTGCAHRVQWQITTQIPHLQEDTRPTPSAAPAPQQTPEPSGGLSRRQMMYGSAGLLTEPTVLVSIYLNDAAGGRVWTEDAKAQSQQYLATAVSWLQEQAAQYGKTVTLYCDDGTANCPLRRSYTPRSTMQGGRDTEESNDFLNEMDALSATLDTAALQQTYSTDRVAFLYFLPLSGGSFTMVHYADDEDAYYYEYSCLYRSDVYSEDGESESPATYAHEILHLFGAPDLYGGSTDSFVDDELVAYVESTYPDEIMYSTYNADGTSQFDAIDKSISPLTAYCLGLADTCPELEQFPKLAQVTPGVFRYGQAEGDGDATAPQDSYTVPGAIAV